MRRIGFITFPGYHSLAFAVTTPFEIANLQAARPVYDLRMLSQRGGLVRTSAGLEMMTERFTGAPYDLLIVGTTEDVSSEVVEFVRRAGSHSRRIAAICHGAFVLAEAGILDGRRATTHWDRVSELRSRYPKVQVEQDRIFVADGSIWTSAGMAANIDLALAIVEEDLGPEAAQEIARSLVLYHRRPGGHSQFSSLLELQPKSDRIQSVLAYARRNLAKRLTIEDLAGVARLSPRQFSRAFQAETGKTPAKAVEGLRLEGARAMLEDTSHTIGFVAQASGFGDINRMRRAFVRAYGRAPHAIRRKIDH